MFFSKICFKNPYKLLIKVNLTNKQNQYCVYHPPASNMALTRLGYDLAQQHEAYEQTLFLL